MKLAYGNQSNHSRNLELNISLIKACSCLFVRPYVQTDCKIISILNVTTPARQAMSKDDKRRTATPSILHPVELYLAGRKQRHLYRNSTLPPHHITYIHICLLPPHLYIWFTHITTDQHAHYWLIVSLWLLSTDLERPQIKFLIEEEYNLVVQIWFKHCW